ncbi:hypothetical protein NKH69_07165 [Mesorhizobium sp. M0976]|uniref:hypothetical protein n=1 Tax=unclassified Mesorhizobium TaxID=325217 RepID=UPI00333D3316
MADNPNVDEKKFNETLKRMLKTPPDPHTKSKDTHGNAAEKNKSPKSERNGDETVCK